MLYLIFAMISSTLISVIMRLSEKKRQCDTGMFIWNYLICAILSLIYTPMGEVRIQTQGFWFMIGLGAISGALYLGAFLLVQKNIKENGIVLSSIFNRLGVLVPVVMAIFIFREIPKLLQILGIVIAVAAIILFNFEKDGLRKTKSAMWLFVMLLTAGITDSMINIFHKLGNPVLSDGFLLFNFIFAMICSILLYLVKKQKMGWWDLLFGVIIGIPNYYSSRFLMLALGSVPSVIAYPIYSVGTLVLLSVVGMTFFHEKLSRQKIVALVLVLAALALLQ